jgi:uncharacterized membrane protein
MSKEGATAPSVGAQRDLRALVGRWWSTANAVARRRPLVDLAALSGVFGVAAFSYWWTRAPLYNPSASVDPWLYSTLFANFDELYEHFYFTYYAARLPWIVPGRIVYGALPLDAAYWVLHGLSFCGGVAAVFFLVRRYLGLAAAVVGGATLALTPIYWNAQYWDYVDGVTSTYLAAGLFFGLPLSLGFRRFASLVAAGVFLASAVMANMFAALPVLIYPIAYVFLQPVSGLRPRLVLAVKDVVAVLAGATVLVIGLGLYARANGGEFLFFQPQLDLIRSDVVGASKIPHYEWLRSEPKLLVPLLLIVVAAPLLAMGRRQPAARFAAASVGGLAFLTAAIYGWEFLAGGGVLDYSYYFSYFAVPIALAMASIAGLALSLARPHWSADVGVAAISTLAAVVALHLIYRDERTGWVGERGGRISVALIAVAAAAIVVALLLRRSRAGAAAAVVAIGALAFASHFAINSSLQTYTYSQSNPDYGGLYRAAFDSAAFVEESTGDDDRLPVFWYRANDPEFMSIQSMYFYAWTLLEWKFPRVTKETRGRLDLERPPTIVMLCETLRCDGGAAALRRAGYSYVQYRVKRIDRERVGLWVVVLRNCEFRRQGPIRDGALLRAPPASQVYAYWRGRKHWIVSQDVLLSAFGANALGWVADVEPLTLGRIPTGRRVTSKRAWKQIRDRGAKEQTAPSDC